MVEEEGEVFRKGSVLLGPEEMEGDYDGEELRVGVSFRLTVHPPERIFICQFLSSSSKPRSNVLHPDP